MKDVYGEFEGTEDRRSVSVLVVRFPGAYPRKGPVLGDLSSPRQRKSSLGFHVRVACFGKL